MKIVRIVLLVAIAAGFAAAILSHEEPGVMTLGLAPLAWLALEGIWRLLDPTARAGRRAAAKADSAG